ncbi:PAP2 superfamily protein [Lacunisphaera limnophila]|uniref:PAP2 superfamily protein n=1 Tax=Lacunisphaera limnophila TaxID=1838286 RepID=A0A1D8AV26_9BACT|nr:vanadium-dependent haloperoxidase [Lacunisphaera limnophila]AOS44749.1 PAP2 superfamily protein [Lacunisphaera limnophila]
MKLPRLVVLAFLALPCYCLPALAADNAVLVWNEQVLNATRLGRNPPPIASLHLATYHAAIYDAVNGIVRTHQPWRVSEPAPAGVNIDAAIAGAAHTVLHALWGQSSNPRNFDIALEKALAEIPDGPAETEGVAYGRKVAAAVLAIRAQSGWNKLPEGSFSSNEPGIWRETPPGFRPPVTPQVATTTPYVMKAPDQFRAPPPQRIDSKEYAEEIAFVNKVGPRDNAERTEYQTLSTPFWMDDLGSSTPAGHWNTIAQDLSRRNKLDTVTCARLFALLNFACADAGISCWDSKYFYRTWRPESAIREEDRKFNPLVVHNPDFIPNMAAPAHPDYTSGHSTFTGAGTRLLERWFGTDEIEFTTTSDGLPGAVRTFKNLSDARREVGMSRVYGGIHTMSANIEGQKAGISIADYVFENALQPVVK